MLAFRTGFQDYDFADRAFHGTGLTTLASMSRILPKERFAGMKGDLGLEINSFHDLITRACHMFGPFEFIKAAGRNSMTYDTFGQLFSSYSETLHAHGLTRASRVGVRLPAGPEQASCLLCTLGSAICVPIGADIPIIELSSILSNLQLDAIIVEQSTANHEIELFHAHCITVLQLTVPAGGVSGIFSLNSKLGSRQQYTTHHPAGSDLALILLTSGTTGSPKHAMHTQAGLAHTAIASSLFFMHTSQDCGLAVMPMHHGQGLFVGLLPVLVSGSSVVCASQLNPRMFFELFTCFQPTWFTAVPSFYQALLNFAGQNHISMSNHRLRYIRSGSAPMTWQLLREVEAFFGRPLLMGYGSAESCHISNNPLPPKLNKRGTVGIAYANEIAIVDSSLQRLPTGQIGEVVVRGKQVTLGYQNNLSANQELFVDGWLRTGDLGSLDGDGYLSLAGRIKDQINRGGESIVPGEIEEVLRTHPSVLDASVFAFSHPTLGEEIAAAIVTNQEEDNSFILTEYLIGRLQASKIPRKFIMLRELPLTRIGKVDKLELKRIVEEDLEFHPIDDPAIGDLEKLVASIISEVLELKPPCRDANFFLLGGDSLSGTRVITRLGQQLSLELPTTLLFDAPTVRKLAERLDQFLNETLEQLEATQ